MRRREFITLLGGAVAVWPLAVRAQQSSKPARIGYLSAASAPDPNLESFRYGMRQFGYNEGRNYILEARYADRDFNRLAVLAAELLDFGIDVMVTPGPAARIAPLASRSVPVVLGFSGDPVDAGLVTSFARPGGNITGVSFLALDLAAKRVDLLKQVAPQITRVAILSSPDHPGQPSELRVTRETAQHFGLAAEHYPVRSAADFDPVFAAVSREGCDALLAFPDPVTMFHRQLIVDFALQRKLPTVFGWKLFAETGGLMSYGPNQRDAYARMAYFVDKILKGAKPADLPIEQPTRLELVINLKTAKAIGLDVPPTLLATADEVIE